MKELKVGEKTKCIITIKAVISDKCEECFFYACNHCTKKNKLECLGKYRSDGKNIIFKLVQN